MPVRDSILLRNFEPTVPPDLTAKPREGLGTCKGNAYVDLEKRAAFRAKERFQEKEKQRMARSKRVDVLRPWTPPPRTNLTTADIRTVQTSWDVLLKFRRINRTQLLVHYLKECPSHVKFHKELWKLSGDKKDWSLKLNRFARVYTWEIIFKLTTLITNLQNATVFQDMVEHYFELFKTRGMEPSDIKAAKESLESYLPRAIRGSHWSHDVEVAWTNVLGHILDKGFELWQKKGYIAESPYPKVLKSTRPSHMRSSFASGSRFSAGSRGIQIVDENDSFQF